MGIIGTIQDLLHARLTAGQDVLPSPAIGPDARRGVVAPSPVGGCTPSAAADRADPYIAPYHLVAGLRDIADHLACLADVNPWDSIEGLLPTLRNISRRVNDIADHVATDLTLPFTPGQNDTAHDASVDVTWVFHAGRWEQS